MNDELRVFFDAYNASFETGPSAIAEFFYEPCITVRMAVPRLNVTRKDTERFFVATMENFHVQGISHAEIAGMDAQHLGSNSALATVRWAYKDVHGKTLREAVFSYNLYKSDGKWKILLLTLHDS